MRVFRVLFICQWQCAQCCARYETAERPTFWYSVMPCTAVRHNRIAMNFKSNHNQIACIQTETSNSQCQIESSSFSRDLNRLMTCICPLLQSKFPVLLSRPFLGLETKTETWTKWTRVHSSLETMVSRSQHWLHRFLILVTEHSLKGCYKLR